jgi:hypothetical protein
MSTNNTEGAMPEEFLEWLENESNHFVYNNTFCKTGRTITETERLNFVSGAKSAYRKLTETKAPVLRWVKASERLPKKGEQVCTKVMLVGGREKMVINHVMKHSGEWFDYHRSVTEWLEEITAPEADNQVNTD